MDHNDNHNDAVVHATCHFVVAVGGRLWVEGSETHWRSRDSVRLTRETCRVSAVFY